MPVRYDFSQHSAGAYFLSRKWKHSSRYFTGMLLKLGLYLLYLPFFYWRKGHSGKEALKSIRVFSAFWQLATTCAIFLLSQLLFDNIVAIVASLCYVFISTSPRFRYWDPYPEKFTVLLMTFCFYLLLKAPFNNYSWWLFLIGFLCAIALILKVMVFFEICVILSYLFLAFKVGYYSFVIGLLSYPIILGLVIYFLKEKDVSLQEIGRQNFFFTKSVKKLNKGLRPSPWQLFGRETSSFLKDSAVLWAASFYTLGLILSGEVSTQAYLIIFWLLAVIISIFLQKSFYEEHTFPLLPGLCILAGVGIVTLSRNILANPGDFNLLFISFFGVIFLGWNGKNIYHRHLKTLGELYSKFMEEVDRAAEYVRRNISQGDYILVWGWNNEIYTLSGGVCPTANYIYCNWLMAYVENQYPNWQEELINEMKINTPKFLVITEHSLDVDCLEKMTGLNYEFARAFGNISILKLTKQSESSQDLMLPEENSYSNSLFYADYQKREKEKFLVGNPEDLSDKLQEALNSLKIANIKKVALFGASFSGKLGLLLAAKIGIDVVAIADNDPRKQGRSFFNIPIISPQGILNFRPQAILITSLGSKDAIFQQIRNLRGKGILIEGLL